MMAGLQHFSLSKGLAPTGVASASLNAKSRGREGKGDGSTHRTLSGESSFVPPNWSRTESVTVAAKSFARGAKANLRVTKTHKPGSAKEPPFHDNSALT